MTDTPPLRVPTSFDTVDDILDALSSDTAMPDDDKALELVAAEVVRLRGQLAAVEYDNAGTRRAERVRLAALFTANSETISAFAADGSMTPEFVAFLLTLDHDPPSQVKRPAG